MATITLPFNRIMNYVSLNLHSLLRTKVWELFNGKRMKACISEVVSC